MMLNNTRQSHTTRPTIGLLIHNIARIGQTILLGIVDAAHEQDVNVLCFEGGSLCDQRILAPDQLNGQGNVLYELVPKTINGFIFWGGGSFNCVSHEEFTQFCHRYRPCPVVTIVGTPVEDVPCLATNSRQGISRVVTHLIQFHGYRRIAYIHGNHVEAPSRYQGYVDALADHGIPIDPALIVGYNAKLGDEDDGVIAINELINEHRISPPDDVEAIMAASDMLAIGAIKALQQHGFRVPEDVTVAGFDDHEKAAIIIPPLTTAHQPFYDMGRQAVTLILRMLRGEEVPAVVEVPVPLIVRESCGCYSSSVSMAAVPESPAQTVYIPLGSVRAEDIIAEMEHAPGSADRTCSSDWMRRLVEGFLAELCADSPGTFLNTLRQIITTFIIHKTNTKHKIIILNDIITNLRHTLFPYYKASSKEREHAEHLWHQARILIGEAQGRIRAQSAFILEQQANAIRGFAKSLITTFDIQGLKEMLTNGLPALGIQSCSLALYEDPQPYAYPQPAPEWSEVLLAYDEHGQHDVTSTTCRFLSRQFLPDHLLPHDRRYTLIVEALYFVDQQIGFIAFEMGPRKTSVYGLLRIQISNALEGAFLVKRIQARSAEIARQKYILDMFMANVPDSIYFKDREGRIIRSNKAYAALFGLTAPGDLVGKSDFDFFPEKQAQSKYNQEQEIIQTGKPILGIEESNAEGSWALTTKMPLRDEHGEIIGIFGISRDITELKQIQQKLSAAYEEIRIMNEQLKDENMQTLALLKKKAEEQRIAVLEANQANQAKSRFLRNMSHEIRTPLNCILGFIDAIQLEKDKNQVNQYINILKNESMKLVDMINQLLDLSKIEAGKFEIKNTRFNIFQTLEIIHSVFSKSARNKGLDYKMNISKDIPAFVMGDSLRLRQVIMNLVGNAIKYTHEGGISISASVQKETDTEILLYFELTDTGIGIPKEYQLIIFDPFVQVEDSMTRKFGGTGLGTAISKQLVTMMGGDIGVKSTVGKGSTFWFTIKCRKCTQEEEPVVPDKVEDLTYTGQQIQKRASILVTEDYPLNRKVVAIHLKKLDCKIDFAENGKIAVNMFMNNKYDLILMDIQMPEMDGIEATKKIRNLPGGKQIPIIAMTAIAYEDDIKTFKANDMDDVITKPFKKQNLNKTVIYWLTHRKKIENNKM